MDVGEVLSVFLRGALGSGGRKRASNAAHFLSGHKGFLSASTLLAAAGVAWGVYDSLKPGASGATGATGAAGASGATGATEREMLRLIRLAVSAARADGALAPQERALILKHAREAGIEQVVEAEIARPQPLAAIVGGVAELGRQRDLYTLAFTIVRADESVTGAERIYLAQLAHHLSLDPAAVAQIESETAAKIDAASADEPGPV